MEHFRDLKSFLDAKVEQYNRPGFIKNDPISIPHRFDNRQDIEIAGFFAAVLAWGRRNIIINKCSELLDLMDNSPHDFISNHKGKDLKRFQNFKHRTFNSTDLLYFIYRLKQFYRDQDSLEAGFTTDLSSNSENVEKGLVNFHNQFFELPQAPDRTRKHISTPAKRSACKRLNMFLRWMVRKDPKGVDFGLFRSIRPSQLVCPCDIHVERVGRKLGLIERRSRDWTMALELTANLKKLDPDDPVKYDFALFGLGIEERFDL